MAPLPVQSLGSVGRVVARVVVGLMVAAVVASGARAQPPDVSGWDTASEDPGLAAPLPAPPEGYVAETRGNVRWDFPAAATSEVRELMDIHREAWATITGDLGAEIDDSMIVRVGRDPEEMAALAPLSSPPPEYASGVTYPRLGLILLTLTAPDSWERPDMDSLYRHELSHLALARAVGGREVPRWFAEGLASYQAGEYSIGRIRTLWSASLSGEVVPFAELSARFPSRPHEVNVAYAQSADVVSLMRDGDADAERFRGLIAELRAGRTFDEAFSEAYGIGLPSFERRWRTRLKERFQAFPLLFTGGSIWVLISMLLVVAYVRRRRRDRRVLARWASEEARAASLASAERAVEAKMTKPAEDDAAGLVQLMPMLDPEPAQARESDVPTIEYEGRNHTLH